MPPHTPGSAIALLRYPQAAVCGSSKGPLPMRHPLLMLHLLGLQAE